MTTAVASDIAFVLIMRMIHLGAREKKPEKENRAKKFGEEKKKMFLKFCGKRKLFKR